MSPATEAQVLQSEAKFRLLVESVTDHGIFASRPRVVRVLQKPIKLDRLLAVVHEYCPR